jgi:hypothetical protein
MSKTMTATGTTTTKGSDALSTKPARHSKSQVFADGQPTLNRMIKGLFAFQENRLLQRKKPRRGKSLNLYATRQPLCNKISYVQIASQQPVKVVALVGLSPTRRVGRFTTEQPGACRPARRRGE